MLLFLVCTDHTILIVTSGVGGYVVGPGAHGWRRDRVQKTNHYTLSLFLLSYFLYVLVCIIL